MTIVCPDCDSQLLERRDGYAYLLRCPTCNWETATAYQHPFGRDQVTYTIVVTSLGEDHERNLLSLNRRFMHGLARTRELFASGEVRLASGRAWEIQPQALGLRGEGIGFRIDPEFPYDLDDPELAPGFSCDWRPATGDWLPRGEA